MSPARRHEAVDYVQRDVGASERRALAQPRSTQRYQHRPKADEAALLQAIEHLVCQHPGYGCRMLHTMLVDQGFNVRRDRVYRLCRTHGYGVKQKARKKRRLGRQGGQVRVSDDGTGGTVTGSLAHWLEPASVKQPMGMEMVKFQSVDGVLEELAVLMLVYNLV